MPHSPAPALHPSGAPSIAPPAASPNARVRSALLGESDPDRWPALAAISFVAATVLGMTAALLVAVVG